jgi:hypothetical protein
MHVGETQVRFIWKAPRPPELDDDLFIFANP